MIGKSALSRALAAAAFVGSMLSAASAVELSVSAFLPPAHYFNADILTPWIQKIEEETQGRVTFKILPQPVGTPAAHYDAVRDGLVDVAYIGHPYYTQRFDLLKIAYFPLLSDSGEARGVALTRILDRHFAAVDLHNGVKLLGIWVNGPSLLHTTKKKVTSADDLQGLKIRVSGGLTLDVSEALGITPVVKPATEIYELLSGGIVDGVVVGFNGPASFKIDDLIKYTLRFPGGFSTESNALIMNPAAFDRLAPEDQAVIEKYSGEFIARLGGKAGDAIDAAAAAKLEAKGVEVNVADDALVGVVGTKSGPLLETWKSLAREAGADPEAVLTDFRAILKELNENM